MKKLPLVFIIIIWATAALCAQDSEAISDDFAQMTISLKPRIDFPLGEGGQYFSIGYGSDLSTELFILSFPYISLGMGVEYRYIPLTTVDSVSLVAAQGGLGFNFPLTKNWMVDLSLSSGYYYGFLTDESKASGGNIFYKLGIGSTFTFFYRYGITAHLHYTNHRSLYQSLSCSLGLAYHLSVPRPAFLTKTREPKITPVRIKKSEQGRHLELSEIEVKDSFPVLYKYYNFHPIGRATLTNWEPVPVSDIELTLYVEDYMDNPKRCEVPPELQAREVVPVNLYALFSPRVLEITESSVTSVLLTLSYKIQDKKYARSYTTELRLNGRNQLSWDDDRKAAAFVTAKDPQVLEFAKSVSGWIKQNKIEQVDLKIGQALGLYEALRLYGISYSPDPVTPFAQFSRDERAVDFLQFPTETLSYKAGDCDDLSILFNALLESLAIETAFITVPGHIYPAFAIDVRPSEASKIFSNTENLLFRDDKIWIPVEITNIQDSFMEAWENGVSQWREFTATGESAFYPTRESWELYEPVGLPGFREELVLPDEARFGKIFEEQYHRLIMRELGPKIASLTEQIRSHPDDSKYRNKLGVLYARYGMIPEAIEQFRRILNSADYVPALVNMGNLAFLNHDYQEALDYFKRAERIDPERPLVLLGTARCLHALENYRAAKEYIEKLRIVRPEMANRYEYVSRGSALRAAEMTISTDDVQWEEE